jgi:class 3 adenylate cyclase/CHASE2 domain-containing sensor protein
MIGAVERAFTRIARAPEPRLRRADRAREQPDGTRPPKRRLEHSLKLDATFLAILVLATGLTFLAFDYVGFLKQAERFVDDVRVAKFLPAEPQHPDIVIAALTEDTLAQFPYRSPVNRAFLANLLKQLGAKGARVIALDVLIDQPTEPENDDLLRQTIRDLKTPLVITYADNVSGQMTDAQQAYLDEFVPPRLRAMGNLATDPFDDTVRRVHPGHRTKDGTFIPGFARAIAARVGIATPEEEVPAVWRGRPDKETEPFAEYPAHLVPVLPAEWFKDKIVLIGAEYTLIDRHRTPFKVMFERDMPGIVIHAHAVAQFLDHKSAHAAGPLGQLLVVGGLAALGIALGALQRRIVLRVVAGLAAVGALWLYGFLGVLEGMTAIPLVMPTVSFGLAMWMTDTVTGREAKKQKEFIQGAFSRYVSPKVVSELIADPSKLSIEGDRRTMTFMFTDIAGFTTLSDSIETKKLAQILNEYLNEACLIIQRHDGTVDKFIGDAIFAIWNAPLFQDDHEQRAVRCAIELDAFAERFRAAQVAAGIPMGVTRIGVHTGEATVGNFGAEMKMEYTALGDPVNTASRLEGINKYFGTRVCVSEATRAKVEGVAFRPLAFIRPKGKLTSLQIYEPLDEERAASDYVRRYREAYRAMEARDPRAPELLEALYAEDHDDKTVALHLKRLRAGETGSEVIMDEK